jgi:iron complex transport system substrate-binding protein
VQPYNFYNTNVETMFVSAYAIGKWLYPERFRDIELTKKSSEILELFLGNRAGKSLRRWAEGYRKVRIADERLQLR